MSALLANLAFMNPYMLFGLLALPVIYFLLRVTPPAPKIIQLPTTRFLEGLKPESKTSDSTPWWILLLRLLIAGLVILAFARPVYNPSDPLPGDGPLHIIIDNDWAATHSWGEQTQMAEDLINQAEREDRNIYLQPTMTIEGAIGPHTAAQALSILKGLEPHPYEASFKDFQTVEDATSIWLSHGTADTKKQKLIDKSEAHIIMPQARNLPLVLKSYANDITSKTASLAVQVDGSRAMPTGMPVTLQVLGESGQVLDQKRVELNPRSFPQEVEFDLPNIVLSKVTRVQIAGRYGAGGTLIFDNANTRRSVGIAGPSGDERMKPFIESRYYLSRALEPFSNLHSGDLETLLDQKPSMLILPDIASMPVETLEKLENWVNKGGLLLRFVGPNMADSNGNNLLPMPLKSSARATDGRLSWEEAPKLEVFPEDSPFFDIELHEDIHVRQQILPATPGSEDIKIWASLGDGTPLVTAKPQKKGLIVLVHTTASPDWSDLALSGIYVEMLKRLVKLSGTKQTAQANYASLQPIWVLDGFGQTQSPSATVKPIEAPIPDNLKPSATHPPGLYGSTGNTFAFNLGDTLPPLKSINTSTLKTASYKRDAAQDFMPTILYIAFMLLMLDWLIMMALTGNLKTLARISVFVLLIIPEAAQAQDIKYAEGLYLAYVKTGNPAIDATSQKGLQNLATILKRRTSAEPDGVASLNLETDTLVFFPFIYWPLSESPTRLSDKALKNVQFYLDHGGTVLFDTRGQSSDSLKSVTQGLNIPPLRPIGDDHVLTRSFYLLDEFPGRYSGQTFWVEQRSLNDRDGVSSVLVGAHDWASAWAVSSGGRSSFTGRSREQELAYRFGVNLMMYALTGNYKADQVHIPHILERLGQ